MARKSRKNIGLIGLGIIGTRVAASLRSAGCHVFVWSRTPKAVPNFLGSPAEIAEICEIIQIFVSDAQAVIDTIESFGDALTSSHVIINCSTIGPEATREAAKLVQEKGAAFLDAPFTGSKVAAEKGQLCYYIGGDEAVFQRVKPMLEATSRAIVKCGKVGDAATLKVATNLLTAVTTQTLAEALAIVQKSGIAPEVFAAAIEQNACKSGVIELKLPKMVRGDFDPHFSLKHMFKDVQLGIHIANSFDLEVPVTTVTAGVMYGALNNGWADLDFSSVYRIYADTQAEEKAASLAAAAELQQIEDRKEADEADEVAAKASADELAHAKIVEPPATKPDERAEAAKEKPAEDADIVPEVLIGDIFKRRAPQEPPAQVAELVESEPGAAKIEREPDARADSFEKPKPDSEGEIPEVIFGRALPMSAKRSDPPAIDEKPADSKEPALSDLEKTVVPAAAGPQDKKTEGATGDSSVKAEPTTGEDNRDGVNGTAAKPDDKPKDGEVEEDRPRFRPLQRIRRFFSPAGK